MNKKEFKQRVNSSGYNKEFSEFIFNFTIWDSENLKFEGVLSLFDYLNNQMIKWNKETISEPGILMDSQNFFKLSRSKVLDLVNGNHSNILGALERVNRYIHDQSKSKIILSHESSLTKYALQFTDKTEPYKSKSLNFITSKQPQFRTKEELIGAILAYEYLYPETEIPKRRNSEKASIASIKKNFNDFIIDSKSKFEKLNDDIENDRSINNGSFKTALDTMELKFNNLISSSETKLNQLDEDWKKNIKGLEETYEKKLQLEAPAKYWSKKSSTFKKNGDTAKYWLIGITAIFAIFLMTLLATAPDKIFDISIKENPSKVVRWSILFLLLVSVLAYLIKTIAKIMFSSYHLARDAEERHTLTFFYLSLLKRNHINSNDHQELILQSLFSRTETGLLKEETAPSMPNPTQIIKTNV